MYGAMRADIMVCFADAWYREYLALCAFFVGLVDAGKLGGGCVTAAA
jgi:hypothetical protein